MKDGVALGLTASVVTVAVVGGALYLQNNARDRKAAAVLNAFTGTPYYSVIVFVDDGSSIGGTGKLVKWAKQAPLNELKLAVD